MSTEKAKGILEETFAAMVKNLTDSEARNICDADQVTVAIITADISRETQSAMETGFETIRGYAGVPLVFTNTPASIIRKEEY